MNKIKDRVIVAVLVAVILGLLRYFGDKIADYLPIIF